MSTSSKTKIPVVNLRHYTHGTPEERAQFVKVWGEGLKEFGFLDVDWVMPVLGGAVTRW